jgi:hypothetical protein
MHSSNSFTPYNIFLLLTCAVVTLTATINLFDGVIPVQSAGGNTSPTRVCGSLSYSGVTSPYTASNTVVSTPINTVLSIDENTYVSGMSSAFVSPLVITRACPQASPTSGILKTSGTPIDFSIVSPAFISSAYVYSPFGGQFTYTPDPGFVGVACFDTYLTTQPGPSSYPFKDTNVITTVIQVGGATATSCTPPPSGPCQSSASAATSGSGSAITNASLCIDSGNLTLYPGDKQNNNDICTNTDINATVANPGFPIIKETITCNTNENSISLGSINTAPTRQNPATIIDDVLFDDLRGQTISGYTITAEVSNFIDYNNAANIIVLGTNPDNEPTSLDTGKVTSVVVTNGGSGYNSAPNISFINGGGTGATATATVSGGVITRIDVKSYGTGYTANPAVIITPTNGGTGATATANIIEAGSNLNPATSLPEATIFATMDPSVGTVYKLKPDQATNPANFITGPRALITAPAIQHTLFATTTGVPTGRYDLDSTIFALRAPAYLPTGDYRSVITQTIVVDSGVTNTAPVVTNGN